MDAFDEVKRWTETFLRSRGLSEDDVVFHYEYYDGSVYINALDKDGNSRYRENGSLDPGCLFVIGCERKEYKQMKREDTYEQLLGGVVAAAWFCFVVLLILTDANVNWWMVLAISCLLFLSAVVWAGSRIMSYWNE